MFKKGKKDFCGFSDFPGTPNGRNLSYSMGKERTRKDLKRLYGMEPVSSEMYDCIMRADNGRATPAEHRVLEQYIKEKTHEIKRFKGEKNMEGSGPRRAPGRIAGALVDIRSLILEEKFNEDKDEY